MCFVAFDSPLELDRIGSLGEDVFALGSVYGIESLLWVGDGGVKPECVSLPLKDRSKSLRQLKRKSGLSNLPKLSESNLLTKALLFGLVIRHFRVNLGYLQTVWHQDLQYANVLIKLLD
jgi:hypothetical protein